MIERVKVFLIRGDEKVPRPKKWRKVCCLPENTCFGPLNSAEGSGNQVNMTIDEYETIRLIDLQGFTQEECAKQMHVARTTVQWIYDEARKKIADSLVNGKVMWIGGGEYQLCDGLGKSCVSGGCRRRQRKGCSDSTGESCQE